MKPDTTDPGPARLHEPAASGPPDGASSADYPAVRGAIRRRVV